MSEPTQAQSFDPEFLDILRCPAAIRDNPDAEDPGRLRLVRDHWLVCDESGYKYPIRDGLPVMLIDEGERWKDTADDELPVPPPPPASNPVDQI